MTNNDDLALKLKVAAMAEANRVQGVQPAYWDLAKPELILALLAERDADKKRIADLQIQLEEETMRANRGDFEGYSRAVREYGSRTVSVKPADQYADDSELLFAIDLNDDCENYQTAQWLKELRRRRAAGINLEVGE